MRSSLRFALVAALLCLPGATTLAQRLDVGVDASLQNSPWTASWIAAPDDDGTSFGVHYFRRTIDLEEAPERFVVHISADNRYRLYVNGQSIVTGPSRGDLYNWRFESVDLAEYLKAGSNVLSAVVWNFGEHRPMAQHSYRTAFLLQGDTERERIADTSTEWRVWTHGGYEPIPVDREALGWVYIVVGPGERIDGAAHPWGWQDAGFDDERWLFAAVVRDAVTEWGPNYGEVSGWRLTPRTIPPMEESHVRFARVRRSSGADIPPAFVEGSSPVTIRPNTRARMLLDQGHLTTAYPELTVSGGRGSRIAATYAEALFDQNGQKGHRDVIEGKEIRGIQDLFLPDGGSERTFRPLWFRTYRYVQLDVETGAQSLSIDDYRGVFTSYPFEEKGRFVSSDETHERIWDVGWRTARLCAGETYFDCPYYEQLQYVGDTRIQALISLYVSGDDQLMKKAIEAFDESRLPAGLTQSRYPSHVPQIIPPYSLFWIVMVHDLWMHREDPAFIESQLTGIRAVVDWYENRLDDRGLIGPTPWWNFVDWSFPRGVPPGGDDGGSSIIALQFVYALQRAAELSADFNRMDEAARYRRLAERINQAVYAATWDEGRELLADTPAGESFSQHANVMGILTGAIPQSEHRKVAARVLADTSLAPCTYYYRFYLDEALRTAGMADAYLDNLDPWHEMLAIGLTTFAEEPDPTRSDAHAWSSSPNYQFLATVCGIRPGSPGFRSVRIEPALGSLEWVRGRVPHPDGHIAVDFRMENGRLVGTVNLPGSVTGTLRWRGKEMSLDAGATRIAF